MNDSLRMDELSELKEDVDADEDIEHLMKVKRGIVNIYCRRENAT